MARLDDYGAGARSAGELADRLQEVRQTMRGVEVESARAFAALAREARGAAAEVSALNHLIEQETADAFAAMLRGASETRRAMERIWDGFLRYFSGRVVRGIAAALGRVVPSPGGIFGSLLGGILSLIGLQHGGLVRGTREGRPFLLGENYTDELVIPLSRVGLNVPATREPGVWWGPPSLWAPQVNVYPQFVIENRAPLEADIAVYELAERGRVRVRDRALVAPPEVEVK